MTKFIYLAISSRSIYSSGISSSLGEELQSTIVTGVRFTRVFNEACKICGIEEPSVGYRTCLNKIHLTGSASIVCKNNKEYKIVFTKVRRI